jgi:hypothetical protein
LLFHEINSNLRRDNRWASLHRGAQASPSASDSVQTWHTRFPNSSAHFISLPDTKRLNRQTNGGCWPDAAWIHADLNCGMEWIKMDANIFNIVIKTRETSKKYRRIIVCLNIKTIYCFNVLLWTCCCRVFPPFRFVKFRKK